MTHIFIEPTCANGYFKVAIHTTFNRTCHALLDERGVEALKLRITALNANVRIECRQQVIRYSFAS